MGSEEAPFSCGQVSFLRDGGRWGLEGHFPPLCTDRPAVPRTLSRHKIHATFIILLTVVTVTTSLACVPGPMLRVYIRHLTEAHTTL